MRTWNSTFDVRNKDDVPVGMNTWNSYANEAVTQKPLISGTYVISGKVNHRIY